MEKPNITVEPSSESLPGRRVYFKLKFSNNDDKDYYFIEDTLFGYHTGGFSINNTIFTHKYGFKWGECTYVSGPSSGLDPNSTQYDHIPANGVFEKSVDVTLKCPFLYREPEGHYWFKYDRKFITSIDLFDTPSIDANAIGKVSIPKVELPFELIDYPS